MSLLKQQKGQGLVEYLILVALMGVATIGVMRLLQNTVDVQFANIINSLQGGQKNKIQAERVEERHYKKKDLGNFINGSARTQNNR